MYGSGWDEKGPKGMEPDGKEPERDGGARRRGGVRGGSKARGGGTPPAGCLRLSCGEQDGTA